MAMKMVVLDGAALNPGDNPWTPVEALGRLEIHDTTSPEQTLARCQGADVLITNKVVLDAELMNQLPQLKFITVTATGYDVVDVESAKRRGIPVSNVPVYSTDSVAQHVFACLLAWIHRPELHDQLIRDGEWQRDGKFSFWRSPMTELMGKTMGIVGWGRIGQATASLARAFGMRVVAHSRTHYRVDGFPGFEWLELDDLFTVADVISLHCPQTETNVGFINHQLISKMKQSAILINTARGGLVNETDLANGLKTGLLAGAILDVVSSEPIQPDNPLLTAPNCLLTPHMAWTTIEARQRAMQTTADNIAAFIDGKPIHVV